MVSVARVWQTVRVFISSTFRDMYAERDHLVKVVFPALRERLEPYRVYLVDVDLRWGVTREQAENHQVTELCLKLADDCEVFLGLLGERYGSVPDEQSGVSLTELEMRRGALDPRPVSKPALFCLRNPSCLAAVPEPRRSEVFVETAPARVERLTALKARIRHSGLPVLDGYPACWDADAPDRASKSRGRLVGLEAFGERVREGLWQAVREVLQLAETQPTEAAADPLAEEADAHERFMESRLRVHVGREAVQRFLTAFVEDDDPVPCLVTGPSGAGKSSALARFVTDYRRQHPHALVIPHFVGASPRSTSLRELLGRFCHVLRQHFRLAAEIPPDAAGLAATFQELLGQVPATTRVLLAIDALNQLDETDRAQQMAWLPERLPPHVKVVATCVAEPDKAEPVLDAFFQRLHCALAIEPLDVPERREVVRLVPSLSAKALDGRQLDLLLSNPATANPLFLLVALEELRGFGSFEGLDERIAGLPHGGDAVTTLFAQVLERLEEEFDAAVVRTVLALLASARRGLSDRELLDLVEGPGVALTASHGDLFPVLRQLRPYLLSRSGVNDFYHRNLFKAVRQRYLDTPQKQRSAHARLADYFHGQSPRSAGAADAAGKLNLRRLDELPWQQLRARHRERLETTLTDFDFVMAKCEAGWLYPLLEDYRQAQVLGTGQRGDAFQVWRAFFEQRVHVLNQADADWPAHRLLLQLAVEHGDDSPVTRAAERWLGEGKCSWTWLRRRSRPARMPPPACLAGVAVGDSVAEMAVNAAGSRAVVLTGRYVTMRNSVDRWRLVHVDLRSLEVIRTEPLPARWPHRPDIPQSLAELLGEPAAPGVDFRGHGPGSDRARLALDLVGYHIPELTRDWEPAAILDGGRRLVTGTHDGMVRVWDARALGQVAPGVAADGEARTALDEARRVCEEKGFDAYLEAAGSSGPDRSLREALGLDLRGNAADRATSDTWEPMNRGLRNIAFRFVSPVRIDLVRVANARLLASWVSDTPLLEPEYDNVVWSASRVIRAVRAGQGLAVETATGTAMLLTALAGNAALDLAALDETVR